MTTEAVSVNPTKVTWGFDGLMNYPMNIMLPIMNMEKNARRRFAEKFVRIESCFRNKIKKSLF
jgi:hypothetical protein